MILKRKQPQDSRKILMAGMTMLALSAIWARFAPMSHRVGEDWVDAVHGFLLGASIALNLWAAWLMGRQRRGGRA